MPQIQITWHGHSCFTLEANGFRILLDPYEDGAVPGCAPLRQSAHQVLCSHSHHDHSWLEGVKLLPQQPSPFSVRTIAVFHDEKNGALRGENTIHIIEYDGLQVAHLGDLGHSLTPPQLETLGAIDALLIPVGGYYTIDPTQAQQIIQAVSPRVIIPMHYRRGGMGFDVLSPLEDFLALRQDVLEQKGNTLLLNRDTPAGTYVLQYQRSIS